MNYYSIYIEKYGKIQSGNKLSRTDYGESDIIDGFTEYDEKGKLAVSIAAQDVASKIGLRSKTEFENHLNDLLK